jgi:hypothetical protein
MSSALTLDDQTIASIAQRADLGDFPFFARARPKTSGCPCSRKPTAGAFDQIRNQVASLPADAQQRLKMLLGVQQLLVPIRRNGASQIVTL